MHSCSGNNNEIACGCILNMCEVCNTSKSIKKCDLHKPSNCDSKQYFLDELRGVFNDIPQHLKICGELEAALKTFNFTIPKGDVEFTVALEIGAGIGNFAPLFMSRGYRYEALEPDYWASKYIRGAYCCAVHNIIFERFTEDLRWDAIIASHVLEHFDDAPGMLMKMFRILKDEGYFYLVIPDDSDLGNPDHKWFFSEPSICYWLEEVGFQNLNITSRQVVTWEKFIYIVAQKKL